MTIASRVQARGVDLVRGCLPMEGRLVAVSGTTLQADGCRMPVGTRCRIDAGLDRHGRARSIEAESIGFDSRRTWLMVTGGDSVPIPGARVRPVPGRASIPFGQELLGRVIDSTGRPLDGKGRLGVRTRLPLERAPIEPMTRAPVDRTFSTGVRAIDSLLTLGRGQRVGLMAGSGVGKSALLGMMTRYSEADVTVVALVGERGREVRDFVEDSLGSDGLARSVVVAVPADRPPLARLRGAMAATAIAEGFRDEGRQILLLVDSLTRFAQAQREIGMSAGEMPVARGYPASVFAALPRLLERAGGVVASGAITAIYTVLAEGDDQQDPVVDAARSILDGHIVLTRALSEAAHFPAIDIGQSLSRTRSAVNDSAHEAHVRRCLRLAAVWREHGDMVRAGLYRAGSDPEIDEAILFAPPLMRFLQQPIDTGVSLAAARRELVDLLASSVVAA